jgi:glycosyltransferase involved in cell wall biosynthesis
VQEVVRDGVSGFICSGVDDAVSRLREVASLGPAAIRAYTQQYFSVERMVQDYLALYRERYDEVTLFEDSDIGSQTAA